MVPNIRWPGALQSLFSKRPVLHNNLQKDHKSGTKVEIYCFMIIIKVISDWLRDKQVMWQLNIKKYITKIDLMYLLFSCKGDLFGTLGDKLFLLSFETKFFGLGIYLHLSLGPYQFLHVSANKWNLEVQSRTAFTSIWYNSLNTLDLTYHSQFK